MSTLLALRSVLTPPVSLSTTVCFQAWSLVVSTVTGPATSNPSSEACRISWYRCDALISALDGMQPTLRHTPPQYCFSTTSVRTPSWPSRMAHG
jgi:hypothetical protein